MGTEADQLILGSNSADSIGSQYSSSSLVGSGGNDTFFANGKVPGVGIGSSLRGGSGSDSFDFNSFGLTQVQLSGQADNDTFRLTGPMVATTIFGGKGEDSVQLRDAVSSSYVYANSGNDTIDVTAVVTNSFKWWGGDDIST